jgi:hypothetical protein
MQSADLNKTVRKIAEQSKVNPSTVQRAEKFADAVDIVAKNTGINPQKILSEEINSARKDIQDVSKMEPAKQKKVFEKVETEHGQKLRICLKRRKTRMRKPSLQVTNVECGTKHSPVPFWAGTL